MICAEVIPESSEKELEVVCELKRVAMTDWYMIIEALQANTLPA